ncbi:tetratricopeptide (TPR) repeat protein [Granulicella aggregans]|uniref:Tetratricopeptide (TPR) repeat protein n=1 Tax=Granulicella aggregans TaxID=474949 RepID=A0A7W7ZCQ4_9BACT|nr:tetratricopeptide repeat protein [Granulicella aggregans]MBB5057428.1 tetratricopeptide (TPR) repeat protein [Granulicella aggregans]
MSTRFASPQGNHNIIVQAYGDGINISVGMPHLTLVPYQNRIRSDPQRDIQILDPVFRAVPLVGRDSDLNFLLNWLGTGETGDIKVTAMIGQGGAGKTRLGLELLEKASDGWDAGILTDDEARNFVQQQNLSAWGWRRPTLILVDYAAALALTIAAWLRGLVDHAPPKHPLRILLLERHADLEGGWYNSLFDTSRQPARVVDLFSPLEPRKLAPLDVTSQRWSVLASGLEAATRLKPGKPVPKLPQTGTDSWFDKRLADPQWADPLLLLMAAIVAFDTGLPSALSLSRPDLAKELAKKEERRLRHSFDDRNPQSKQDADFLVHLYACVTLCGGLDHHRLLDLAEQECGALHVICSGGPGSIVTILERLTGGAAAVPTITPDLLAEAFWLSVLARQGSAAAVETVTRLLPLATQTLADMLVRSATDYTHTGEKLPLAALTAIAEDPDADFALLSELARALPKDTLALRAFAFKLIGKLVKRPRESADAASDPAYVNHLFDYSHRQSSIGDRAGALVSITEAVDIYRRLALVNLNHSRPDLARSLHNLSNRQSEIGDPAGALASITEAVNIYRDLAFTNPNRFRPDLASSLNNLSNQQSEVDDRSGALRSITEAINISRNLVSVNPDRFLPDLARALNNLSNRQSEIGDPAGALVSITEAVNIYRDLASTNPDRFRPGLAVSLMNLSKQQSEMDDRAGALDSITEAVATHRELAPTNPDRFITDLAWSLSFQGNHLAAVDRLREALDSTSESLGILAPYYTRYPNSFSRFAPAAVNDYLFCSQELNLEPDEKLLLPYRALIEQYNLRTREGATE